MTNWIDFMVHSLKNISFRWQYQNFGRKDFKVYFKKIFFKKCLCPWDCRLFFFFFFTDFWTLWEKARVGWSERTASKHVYYQVWNRLPVQVGCMRQVLGAGALGWPRGMGLGGRWEGGSGWGTHVNPWLIHVNVWQKPLQYCKVISLQLIKINEKKKRDCRLISSLQGPCYFTFFCFNLHRQRMRMWNQFTAVWSS